MSCGVRCDMCHAVSSVTRDKCHAVSSVTHAIAPLQINNETSSRSKSFCYYSLIIEKTKLKQTVFAEIVALYN